MKQGQINTERDATRQTGNQVYPELHPLIKTVIVGHEIKYLGRTLCYVHTADQINSIKPDLARLSDRETDLAHSAAILGMVELARHRSGSLLDNFWHVKKTRVEIENRGTRVKIGYKSSRGRVEIEFGRNEIGYRSSLVGILILTKLDLFPILSRPNSISTRPLLD